MYRKCINFLLNECSYPLQERHNSFGAYSFTSNVQACEKFTHLGGVYCLVDPVTYEICYIGISHDPIKRHKQHCYVKLGNMHQGNLPFSLWLHSIKEIRKKPQVLILQCTSCNNFQFESQTIKEFWHNGHPLLNSGLGGGIKNRERRLEWVERIINSRWNKQRNKLVSSGGYYPKLGLK